MIEISAKTDLVNDQNNEGANEVIGYYLPIQNLEKM